MALLAGARLGPYEILSPIGAGGMGEVYRARDSKLDRDVAIKVLPAHLTSDPDALARFEREAKAVAALSHPNILSIFDFGVHDGVSYAVTELLEGQSLRDRLEAGPLSSKQAVDYALQIARGLSAAHERGVVHRDLKPENLFVSKESHLKILDFGLAKREDRPAPGDETSAPTVSGLTRPGTIMGTAGYMSPEQVRGVAVDHRSDVFSLGAILYEMLSGTKPFVRSTASDTMAAILRDEPPELSASGSVPPVLDHVVRHCLEKDRDQRFQSARDVVFALSEATVPTGVVARAAPGPGRNRILVAAAVVLVLAVAALMLRRRPEGAAASAGVKRLAVIPFENLGAPEDDYFADGIADEIRGKLTTLPGLEVIARGSSTPYKKTSKTPQQIAHELDVAYLLTATVRWQKGAGTSRVHVTPELVEVKSSGAPASRWQQTFDAALTDVFQVQSDIATRAARALGVALGEGQQKKLSEKPTENLAAYDAFLRGEEAARALSLIDPPRLRAALAFYEQAVRLDPAFALAWARISVASSLLYVNVHPTTALETRAREAAEKAVALAPDRPDGHLALGHYDRLIRADSTSALEEYTKGLSLAPRNSDLVRALGRAETALGRWDDALAHAREAVRLDPRSPGNHSFLGGVLLALHRWPEARGAFDRGLALSPTDLHQIEGKCQTFLGEGNLAGCRAVLKDAHARVESMELVAYFAAYEDLGWVLEGEDAELLERLTPSAFDDDAATWAMAMAQAFALRGEADQSRSHAEKARAAYEGQLRDAPDDPQLLALRGVTLAYLGRKEEAVREGERASALLPVSREGIRGPYVLHQLVRIYVLVGEREKALDALESLLKVRYPLSPGWLRIDPTFSPLRGEPRFQKLVAGGT
jgi:TolB-like protein/Flp pilus assembly protein TadD